MGQERQNPQPTPKQKRPVRPALIISERTCYEYSMFLRHLLAGLADESIPVALICPRDCDLDPIISPNVELIQHPMLQLPLMTRANRRMILERLTKFRPTILHCLCDTKSRLTIQLARQLNLPYVMTINSLSSRRNRPHIDHRLCANILVPADTIASGLTRLHPKSADKIRKVPVGTFADEQSCCFSADGGFASLVTTCPIDHANKFENLLNAVRHLVIDGHELMLVIMGTGRGERQLRELLNALKLLWVVTIVPSLQPWRSVISAADIFIRPQPRTTFDPFLLEAMSMASAVAACTGGVDDLITDGKTCLVFDPADELSIYNCLQKLLDRRDFARKLAKTARQYVRENHSVSKMVADILDTYRNADPQSKNRSSS